MFIKIATVGFFLLIAAPLIVVKVRTTQKEKYKIMAQSGNPDLMAKAVRRDMIDPHRYLFSSSLPWVEIKDTTAIIQFDARPGRKGRDEGLVRIANQKQTRKLFEKSANLLSSSLGVNIPLSYIRTVVVSAYETRQDKMDDKYKVCVLSLRADREIVAPSKSRMREESSGYSFEIRFDPNDEFVLRDVVAFESNFDREEAVLRTVKEEPKSLEEIQALSLPALRKMVKRVFSYMEYEVSELPIAAAGDKGYLQGNLVEKVFTDMGHVENKKSNAKREIDMVAVKEDEKVGVGCIVSHHPVEQKIVEDFYSVLTQMGIERGYFVTNNMFSLQAMAWADNRLIELIDGKKLKDLLESLVEKEREAHEVQKERKVAKEDIEIEKVAGADVPEPKEEDVAQVTPILVNESEIEEKPVAAENKEAPVAAEKIDEAFEPIKPRAESPIEEESVEEVPVLEDNSGHVCGIAKRYDFDRGKTEKADDEELVEDQVAVAEDEQTNEINKPTHKTTDKCPRCGWTFDKELGSCPRCTARDFDAAAIHKELWGDSRKANRNIS